jgi:hypothetical protein
MIVHKVMVVVGMVAIVVGLFWTRSLVAALLIGGGFLVAGAGLVRDDGSTA